MLASVDHPCWTYSYESGGVRKTLWSEVTFWYFRNKTWNFSIEGISHFFHCELAMLLKQRNTTLILSCLCSLLRLAAAAADVEVVSASAVFPLQTQSQLDLTSADMLPNCLASSQLFLYGCVKKGAPIKTKLSFPIHFLRRVSWAQS